MTTRTVSYAGSDEELFREQMRTSAHGDGASPRTFAYLLAEAAKTRVWERLTDKRGRRYESFRAFLGDGDPYGLGMTEDELRHAAALAGVLDLVARLLNEEIEPAAPAVHAGPGRGHKTNSTTDGFTRPDRETAGHVVARLKRDDPALAEKVVNGEVSAYAAARAKGWKPPRIQVTTPERTAAHLRKHMSPKQLAELARLLLGDGGDTGDN
jgi:hypothetical protein